MTTPAPDTDPEPPSRAPFSAYRRLSTAERIIGKPLYPWIKQLRSDDVCPCCHTVTRGKMSWRAIATEIERTTARLNNGKGVVVSHQGLHEWFKRHERRTAA